MIIVESVINLEFRLEEVIEVYFFKEKIVFMCDDIYFIIWGYSIFVAVVED